MGQITSCLLTVQAHSAVLAAVGSRQCNLSLSRRRVGRTWHFDLASFQTVSNWPLSALGDKIAPPPLYMSGPFSSEHGCLAPIPNCLIFSPIPTYQNINLSAREAQQKLSQHPTWLTFSTNSSPHCLPSNGSGRQQRYGKWKYFLHISDRGLDSTLCW